MRRLLIYMTIVALMAASGYAKGFSLKVGDILFKEYPSDSAFTDAVVAATSSLDRYRFSHVGVVTSSGGKLVVTEAVFSGVKETPLDSFLLTARHAGKQPIVLAARLKKTYRKAIKPALPRLKSLLGKPYDRCFLPDNDQYYCSELIYATFLIDGKPIFESRPMTFKDKETGEMSPLWIRYFNELNCPIPEGVTGTNPGDMSRSKILDILGLVPNIGQ